MTTGEILNKIKFYYPNTFTDAQIVDTVNEVQGLIFREMQQSGVYTFSGVKDQHVYTLPAYITIEFIDYISVAQAVPATADTRYESYKYISPDSDNEPDEHVFTDLNGQLLMDPAPPLDGANVNIYFKRRPTALSASDATKVPDLRADWHMALVYGALSRLLLAGNNPDIELSNNYSMMANKIIAGAQEDKWEREPKYQSTKDVMKSYSRNRIGNTPYIKTPYN
jgi:hypothetical protein